MTTNFPKNVINVIIEATKKIAKETSVNGSIPYLLKVE